MNVRQVWQRLDAAGHSLRGKLLLVIFGGAVLPLAGVGVWLTRSAERSGRELLASRLDQSLQRIATDASVRWRDTRSEILSALDSPELQRALRTSDAQLAGDSLVLDARGDARRGWVLRWAAGDWQLRRTGAPSSPAMYVALPAYASGSRERLGVIHVAVPAAELFSPAAGGTAGVGALLAVFDPETGASLLPLPFEPERMRSGQFEWEGEEWLARYRTIGEPRLIVALASSLSPYLRPFAHATRQGAFVLGAVALLGSLLVILLTRRMTRSLASLATAAEAVTAGDLQHTVEDDGRDEVAAVARAFNTMTRNLSKTLDQLSRQQGLASVGEFAASLAHEVRNPLTAIRIELQSIEEETTAPNARAGLARALRHVQRLEATVAGSLRVARGGQLALTPIDLRAPLESAWRTARPDFDARGATLRPLDPALPRIAIRADAAAIEQLFLNLLLNAAQALERGGEASGDVHLTNGRVEVAVRDSGRGIEPERMATIFEPIRSTRPDGTGLGLTIARRIAQAHGGDMEIESSMGAGTTVRVQLPALNAER
jgi:signal transduction histidine kinase